VKARFDRRQIYQLALWEVGRICRAFATRTLFRLKLRASVPTRLLFAPQDLRTGDPTIANDIYSGFFVFSGRAIATSGRSPFEYEPPSRAWGEALYGFGWLRHLRAAGTALAQVNARALVDDFMVNTRHAPVLSQDTGVKARRLISFISQSPLLLEGADREFYQRFLKTIGRMVRDLERDIRISGSSRSKLIAAIACCYAGLCCEGLETPFQRMMRVLLKELDDKILPDGGHVSRNPRLLIELLFDLLPLRQIFASRGLEPPAALNGAIDRMLPMIRMLRHGDGDVARFNGMAATAADHLATLLLYDEVRARPIQHATHSGYERLEAGSSLLIADTGRPPPFDHSLEATAGTLSFELSSGNQCIVVNCGMPRFSKESVEIAARTTAAHSTASVGLASSMTFLGVQPGRVVGPVSGWLVERIGRVVLSGPEEVRCERGEWNNGTMLAAAHDSYKKQFGVVHERRWFMSEDGGRLNGEDSFQGAIGSDEVTIRFHLAPGVRAERVEQGSVIVLALPNRELWQFESTPLPQLDASMFFAAAQGAQKTEQIVISFKLNEVTNARWRFIKLGAAVVAADAELQVEPDVMSEA